MTCDEQSYWILPMTANGNISVKKNESFLIYMGPVLLDQGRSKLWHKLPFLLLVEKKKFCVLYCSTFYVCTCWRRDETYFWCFKSNYLNLYNLKHLFHSVEMHKWNLALVNHPMRLYTSLSDVFTCLCVPLRLCHFDSDICKQYRSCPQAPIWRHPLPKCWRPPHFFDLSPLCFRLRYWYSNWQQGSA